jgi:hypothetical protein
MTRTKITAVLGIVTATVATAVMIGPGTSHAETGSRAGTIARFAGLPPVGVKASTPTTGRPEIGFSLTGPRAGAETTTWYVYADGRFVWQKWSPPGDATVVPTGAKKLDTGYVQQRLTLSGVQLLRSKILATGLFEHNLKLEVGRGKSWVTHQVRRGDRMVTVAGVPTPDPSWTELFTKATPAQTRALAQIAALVADPAKWLPTNVWSDRQIRTFVPSHYLIAVDRSYPEISKLPPPADEALSRHKQLRRHACQVVTTGQARALLQALMQAGISPSDNHAWNIGFDFHGLGFTHPSYLHLSPVPPDDVWNGWC